MSEAGPHGDEGDQQALSVRDASLSVRDASLSVRGAARTHARDRYLTALLAPAAARDDLVVLAAYLGEVARIPLLAHDAYVGEIRVQWWRDVIDAPDRLTGHPVADALAALTRRRSLSRDLLLAVLEARSRELYEDGIADDRELATYAEEAEGAPIRLAIAVIAGARAGVSEAAIIEAARGLALTRLALTLPQHLALGRLPLPAEFISRARDPRGLGESEARQSAGMLTAMLGSDATAAFDRFRALQDTITPEQFPAFLPVCLIPPYLQGVLRPARDGLREVADISPLSRVMRLWFAHWRGRV